uniref:Uncharacterized protein n=1 Tax=Parascaris equorum TaxID=6256 RepID=A0A914RYG3_PAREQ
MLPVSRPSDIKNDRFFSLSSSRISSFDCIRLSGFSDGLAVSTIIDFSRKSTAAGSFTDFLPFFIMISSLPIYASCSFL